jgi:hypothetical protein
LELTMTLRMIVAAVAVLIGRGSPPPVVADAIVQAAATPDEAALLTLYAGLESGYQEHPRPQSWDALAGRACGVWQQLCVQVSGLSVEAQARLWIHDARAHGLAGLTGSAKEAARRQALAAALLERVTAGAAERQP